MTREHFQRQQTDILQMIFVKRSTKVSPNKPKRRAQTQNVFRKLCQQAKTFFITCASETVHSIFSFGTDE